MVERITSLETLQTIGSRVAAEQAQFRLRLMICGSYDCHLTGSDSVKTALEQALDEHGLTDQIQIVETGCIGSCSMGPVMTVLPDGIFYMKLQASDIPELMESHLLGGTPVARLMYHDPASGRAIPRRADIPFFALQQSFVLRNKGLINPGRIEDYIWRGGYQAMYRSLTQLTPAEVIAEVKASGLRGRGGGGFPTGMKWEFCASAKGEVKYVLCNADEGDPGAFMDRRIMEDDPHSVLEGMVIGARAIAAHQGYIYCRAEYPLAIERLTGAIAQAEARGLLGPNIMDTGFDFTIEIYQGAGAFVCGEETALMTSIEGKRGVPRPRPPFPAVSGLWGQPSILNNVETWSSVPHIIRDGGAAYAEIGTESSKGTKVFAVTGKVNNIGLVEVPMGTPIGRIIFDIGGGVPDGKKFKAAQLGGPSGGCVPAQYLNLPTDYEEIAKAGAIMGSGGLIVMDEDTCMVDMARYFMDFCQDESCGKCTPCRVGTKRMLQVLENICQGHGRPEDLDLLASLSAAIKDAALCGLGQTAPNPVESTLRYFRDEYEAHIFEKRCPAGVCADLFQSTCQNACPVGMDIPAYIALIRADRLDDAYRVVKRTNPFPSVCGRVCSHPCQSKCRRDQLDEALAIRNLKRFITDYATPPRVEPFPITQTEKIAVVGAGPAGLTAALEMQRRGYAVTVFEAFDEAGGMLRWGIPAYRLPREILSREIQAILDTGVVLQTGVKVGVRSEEEGVRSEEEGVRSEEEGVRSEEEKSINLLTPHSSLLSSKKKVDLPFAQIEENFEAIYLALGAQKSLPLGLDGDTAQGVMGAVEFLRDYNLGKPVSPGARVAVIGGGNSAVDAARTAVRLGAQSVTILYRRERKDMPALADEIVAAEQEGVRMDYLVAPQAIIVQDNHITGLKLVRMQLGPFDASGRRRPLVIPGSEFELAVDTLIPAIGQQVDADFLSAIAGLTADRNALMVHKDYSTDHSRIWAGGDLVTGPAMVIDAIAAGQKAAAAMDRHLRAAKGEPAWEAIPDGIEIPFEIDEEPAEQPQVGLPELAPAQRRQNFREVELGYDPEMARREARRCVRCDVK